MRPCVAKDLKGSEFTSIKERIDSQNTWLSGFGKGDTAESATEGCLKSDYDFHTSGTAADISTAIHNDKDWSF